MTTERMGGLSALVCAATYVFGFAFLVTVLAPIGFGSPDLDSARVLAFEADTPGLLTLWYTVIYIVNAVFLALLAVALHARLRHDAPGFAVAQLVFGALWATLVLGAGMMANVGLETAMGLYGSDPEEAARLWTIFSTVENGIGGGNEIAGGVWALTLGLAGLATRRLPRVFAIVSIVIGCAGLLTMIPAAGDIAGAVFGLGYIAWFIWVGLILLRQAA